MIPVETTIVNGGSSTAGRVEARLGLLVHHFLNRTDVLCHKAEWGKPCPLYPEPDQLPGVLLSHLTGDGGPPCRWESKTKGKGGLARGPYRVGTYTPGPDGRTRFAVVDVDGEGHARPVLDVTAAALSFVAAFRRGGLPCHLERSKGGKGWHVWVFFDEPASATVARDVLISLLPRDVPLAGGGYASDKVGLEVFPKRADAKTRAGLGNQVWLPWWHGAAWPNNQFYTDDPGGLEPFEPRSFATEGGGA